MTVEHDLSDEEVIEAFFKVWGDRWPVFRSRFLGIKTLQNPLDAWIIQEIIWEVKPDFIVEAGNYHGGSSVLWAMLLDQVNPNGRIISIDIEDRREERAKTMPIVKDRVEFILGSSIDPVIVDQVRHRVDGQQTLVILDSNHTYDHVRAEIEAFAPLIGEGSYLIVQDTPVGPIDAVHEFVEDNPDFVIDKDRERFMVTNTVDGYLRRVSRLEGDQARSP